MRISVWDPDGEKIEPRGKQVLQPHGMFFTECSGIWGTVWLEPVGKTSITHLVITPDVQGKTLYVRVRTRGPTAGCRFVALAGGGAAGSAMVVGPPGKTLALHIAHPKLWSPTSPFLYHMAVAILRHGRPIDHVHSYFAMRSISVGPGTGGHTEVLLNGKPLFERGTLYQGYWPDGLYTPPTDRAIKFDILAAKKMGFNMFRVHQIVEPLRFYYWADRLGILLWQDMPAAWAPKAGTSKAAISREILSSRHWWPANGPQTAAEKREYRHELLAMIRDLRNDPSVVVWTLFNEGWGEHNTPQLVKLINKTDPSRLVDDASGWFDKGVGNIIDTHHYPQPESRKPTATRAAISGEFGGFGRNYIRGHEWAALRPGPQILTTAQALARYRLFWKEAYQLRRTKGISAAVYTELMDQEQELGGLMTFDRAVVKLPIRQIRRATLGHFKR